MLYTRTSELGDDVGLMTGAVIESVLKVMGFTSTASSNATLM